MTTCHMTRCRKEGIQSVILDGDGGLASYCERHWRRVAKLPPIKKVPHGNCERCGMHEATNLYPVGARFARICLMCWNDKTRKGV